MSLVAQASESGAAAFISDSTPTTMYTNAQGAGKGVRVVKLVICNIDESNDTWVSIYKVPSGGSISGTNYAVVWKLKIPASGQGNIYGSVDIRQVAGMILENGDSLRALAGSASDLRYDISTLAEA